MVQNIIIPSPINIGKLRIYCDLSPLSKKDQKTLKWEWVKNHGQISCTIKYHGLKNLGSSYKYIVKVSPKTLLTFHQPFHLFLLFPYFFHIIFHGVCWAFSILSWIHSPFLTTISEDDSRTRPWSGWTIYSNDYSGPCYWKVCFLLFFIS